MTDEQLELMVARTGKDQLRKATREDNPDARERDLTRRWVEEAAAFPTWPPPRPADAPNPRPARTATFDELRRATKLGSARCWFSVKDSACGCNGLQCHLKQRRVNVYDCVGCLKTW